MHAVLTLFLIPTNGLKFYFYIVSSFARKVYINQLSDYVSSFFRKSGCAELSFSYARFRATAVQS